MKTRKLYEIRVYRDTHPMESSTSIGHTRKLRTYVRARKLVRYLKARYGVKAFAAPLTVTA